MLLHYLAKRGNTKITYFTQLDCVTHTMHLCAIFLKEKKLSSVMCLIAYDINFVEVVRYPINTVHWLLLQAWRRTTPIFYTATDTVTDLAHTQSMWVAHSRMLCSLPRSCLVHPVDRFDSERSVWKPQTTADRTADHRRKNRRPPQDSTGRTAEHTAGRGK